MLQLIFSKMTAFLFLLLLCILSLPGRAEEKISNPELLVDKILFVSIKYKDNENYTNPVFSVLPSQWGKPMNWVKGKRFSFDQFITYFNKRNDNLLIFNGGYISDDTETLLYERLTNCKARCIIPAFGGTRPPTFMIEPRAINLVIVNNKERTYSINGSAPTTISSKRHLVTELKKLRGIIYVFQPGVKLRIAPEFYKARFEYRTYMGCIHDFEFRGTQNFLYLEELDALNNSKRAVRILYSDGRDYFFYEYH